MPIRTETTEDFLGIIQTGSGLVTGDEFVEACHAALRLVQNTRNFHYEFVDLSDATELRVEVGDLDRIIAHDRLAATYRPDVVVVIVAPQDDFFELGKIWERRVQDLGWSTHITRDRIEARQWLKANFPRPAVKADDEMTESSPVGSKL